MVLERGFNKLVPYVAQVLVLIHSVFVEEIKNIVIVEFYTHA